MLLEVSTHGDEEEHLGNKKFAYVSTLKTCFTKTTSTTQYCT